MLKELRKNKMSVVVTGILFGVMGVLIIPIIAGIVKILGTLSQKYPRICEFQVPVVFGRRNVYVTAIYGGINL